MQPPFHCLQPWYLESRNMITLGRTRVRDRTFLHYCCLQETSACNSSTACKLFLSHCKDTVSSLLVLFPILPQFCAAQLTLLSVSFFFFFTYWEGCMSIWSERWSGQWANHVGKEQHRASLAYWPCLGHEAGFYFSFFKILTKVTFWAWEDNSHTA